MFSAFSEAGTSYTGLPGEGNARTWYFDIFVQKTTKRKNEREINERELYRIRLTIDNDSKGVLRGKAPYTRLYLLLYLRPVLLLPYPWPLGHTDRITSQLAKPLLQLSGRVLRHGGVAATDVLTVDPDAWDSALPRHVGQKALHVMAISSLVELNYSWTHGQAGEELLCLRAEAAPDPCMSVHGMLRCTSASGSGRVHMAGTTSC